MKLDDTAAIDQRLIKALGHPLRERLLHLLNEQVASPNQMAKALDEALGSVAYHVQILLECEAIELVRTKPVRGALEHFYRATMPAELSGEHWAALPPSVRRNLDAGNLDRIWTDVSAAALSNGFDDEQSHISWTELDLDAQAYDALAEELIALIDRAIELQAETINRRARLGDSESKAVEAVRRTELAILHFERPPAKRLPS